MTAARPRLVSRRVLGAFLGLVGFTCAELAWWITFQVRSSHQQTTETRARWEFDRRIATDLIALQTQATGASTAATLLTEKFPHLVWQGGGSVQVRQDALDALAEKHRSRIRMFVSEGLFFLAMVVAGAVLIFRTMHREVSLTKQQANFLSAVTHELKSPLASIRLYIETIQLRAPPADKLAKYLRSMSEDVERLESLVTNLLSVARLDAQGLVLHLQHSDLGRDVQDIVHMLRREMAERGLDVDLVVGNEPIWVRMDMGALQTILRNLLDNAIKYGQGKPVQLRVAKAHNTAVLEVRDQGIGLPQGEEKKIFQKFYRVGDEMVRQTQGSGLGLYLVHTLVGHSGGSIVAESAGPGCGTLFRMHWPLDESRP